MMNNSSDNIILNQVKCYRDEALHFLNTLTLSESPSTEPETQIQVREQISKALRDLGFTNIHIPGNTSGGSLYARPRVKKHASQMIIGHYDTAWPVGTLAKMPFEVDGNILRGPGTYDMKADITQVIFVLKTLQQLMLKPSSY